MHTGPRCIAVVRDAAVKNTPQEARELAYSSCNYSFFFFNPLPSPSIDGGGTSNKR